jgi:hypothetical protein
MQNKKNDLRTYSSLTKEQERFLKAVLTHVQKKDLGKRFDLLHQGNKRYIKIGKVQINVNLSDHDLVDLSRLGYILRYASPPAIEFSLRIWEQDSKPKVEELSSPELQVFRINILQVYAWLVASLLAALFSLFLLWLTFQQILDKSISTTVASAILTMITSLLTGVFFKNYDKANDRLKAQSAKTGKDKNEYTGSKRIT